MSINAAQGYGDVASTSEGTKVTKDPEAQKPVQEASGIVTSDSLAAESQQHGGGFNAAPSDQPSKGTTTNNTDTSGAAVLQPARDKAERGDDGRVDEKLGGNDGRGPTDANTDASSGGGVQESQEQKDKSSTSTSAAKDSTTSDAPSYASAAAGKAPHQPKSQTQTQQTPTQTTEGTSNTTSDNQSSDNKDTKITGDEPNTSFTTAIGSKDDPALLAEQRIQASNARSGADAGLPNAASGKIEDKSQYKVLGETSS